MLNANDAPARAKWEVLWLKDRRVIRKRFDHDLAAALMLYARVTAAGRKGATLRCTNMAFPPPDRYADHETVIITKGSKRFKGKRLVEPRRYQVRMMHMNRRGWWWCPYCMKMRKFVKRSGFYVGEVYNESPHLACPMCGASHRVVNRYNPLAELISSRVQDPDRKAKRARRRRQRQQEEEDE